MPVYKHTCGAPCPETQAMAHDHSFIGGARFACRHAGSWMPQLLNDRSMKSLWIRWNRKLHTQRRKSRKKCQLTAAFGESNGWAWQWHLASDGMEWEQVRDPPVLGFSDPAAAEVACGFVFVCIACCSLCPCTEKNIFHFISLFDFQNLKKVPNRISLLKKSYLKIYKF